MLESLRSGRCSRAIGAARRLNIAKLVEVLMRLSYLAADYPRSASSTSTRCSSRPAGRRRSRRPDRHRPGAPDGGPTALRPPGAAPLPGRTRARGDSRTAAPSRSARSSPRTSRCGCTCSAVARRSRSTPLPLLLPWASHEVATRYCYIDYDREIAIVAEVMEKGQRALIGVGRLIADPTTNRSSTRC